MRDYKPSRRTKQNRDMIKAVLLIIAFILLLGIAGKSDNDSRIITDSHDDIVCVKSYGGGNNGKLN
jgi:hypothetical protein